MSQLVVREDNVAGFPGDRDRLPQTVSGRRYPATVQRIDAVVAKVALQAPMGTGPDREVRAQGLVDIAQHDAQQQVDASAGGRIRASWRRLFHPVSQAIGATSVQ